MPRRTARKSWSAKLDEAFAYRDRVLSEVATLATEQGVKVAFASDAALAANGLERFVRTRAISILSHPVLHQPPPGVVVRDVAHASDVRLFWRALARSGKVPCFPIPIVRREHLAAFAMLERDWEAFHSVASLMVPFRRRTARRVVLRDLGRHAARKFDVAATYCVGSDWRERQ